jgi:hypothetical protein
VSHAVQAWAVYTRFLAFERSTYDMNYAFDDLQVESRVSQPEGLCRSTDCPYEQLILSMI